MEIAVIAGIFIAIAIAAELFKAKANKQPSFRHTLRRSTKVLPHALTMLIMVSHASEITRVVSHVKVTHIAISALLFGIWLVSIKTTKEEL